MVSCLFVPAITNNKRWQTRCSNDAVSGNGNGIFNPQEALFPKSLFTLALDSFIIKLAVMFSIKRIIKLSRL